MSCRTLVAAVLAAVVLVACADDGPDAGQRRQLSPPTTENTVAGEQAEPEPPPEPEPAPEPEVPTPAAPNGLSVRVQSLDNFFRPEVIEISAGTEVVWTNDGRMEHDVISPDGGDWGVAADLFFPGDEYRHVFTLPGEYPYYCSLHGNADFGMLGLVIVTG